MLEDDGKKYTSPTFHNLLIDCGMVSLLLYNCVDYFTLRLYTWMRARAEAKHAHSNAIGRYT